MRLGYVGPNVSFNVGFPHYSIQATLKICSLKPQVTHLPLARSRMLSRALFLTSANSTPSFNACISVGESLNHSWPANLPLPIESWHLSPACGQSSQSHLGPAGAWCQRPIESPATKRTRIAYGDPLKSCCLVPKKCLPCVCLWFKVVICSNTKLQNLKVCFGSKNSRNRQLLRRQTQSLAKGVRGVKCLICLILFARLSTFLSTNWFSLLNLLDIHRMTWNSLHMAHTQAAHTTPTGHQEENIDVATVI